MRMALEMWNTQAAPANGGVLAGSKRRADESSLTDSDRFTKRFNLLNLGMKQSVQV